MDAEQGQTKTDQDQLLEIYKCTAIGNSDHTLNQDRAIITI